MYSLENAMATDITASMPKLFNLKKNYAHAIEIPEGSRIIDFVFTGPIQPNSYKLMQKEYSKELRKLSISQLHVLAIIWQHNKININRLSAVTYLSKEVLIDNFLKPMLNFNLILEENNNKFIPTNWSKLKLGEIFTIEAKLYDWKNAFFQALDNQNRTDYSYIAFPSGNLIKNKKILEKARSRGIGIIEVNSSFGAEIVVKAQKTNLCKDYKKRMFHLKIMCGILNSKFKWKLNILQNEN